MDKTKSIYGELFDYYKNTKTEIGQKVFDILNREAIANIIQCENVFWFEFYINGNDCAENIYEHIKRYLKKQGLTYLYDIEKGESS